MVVRWWSGAELLKCERIYGKNVKQVKTCYHIYINHKIIKLNCNACDPGCKDYILCRWERQDLYASCLMLYTNTRAAIGNNLYFRLNAGNNYFSLLEQWFQINILLHVCRWSIFRQMNWEYFNFIIGKKINVVWHWQYHRLPHKKTNWICKPAVTCTLLKYCHQEEL